MFRRLRVDFHSLDQFQEEYQGYLEHGQLFVATHQELSLREVVDLELALSFCGRVVTMQAEVRGYRNWREERTRRGVSVQLLEPIENLRLAVADATGMLFSAPTAAELPPDAQAEPPQSLAGAPVKKTGPAPGGVRGAERSLARVTITVEGQGLSAEGTTYDLSNTGALLVFDDAQPEIGAVVKLVMFHPTTDRTQNIPARVVRHAETPSGAMGVGVSFEFPPGAEEEARGFIDEVRAIEIDPKRRAETITGSIDVLGLPTLVQVFSASVNEGTISLVRGQERGRIVFADGTLRYARTGQVTGLKALCRLLGWQTGVFHFAPTAEAEEELDERPMMHRALFECIQKLDELGRVDISGFPPKERVIRLEAETEKLEDDERAVLDFLKDEATVREIIDGVDGFDVDIYCTLESLLEMGLIDLEI